MKISLKIISLLLALVILLSVFVSCRAPEAPEGEGTGDLSSLEIEGEETLSLGIGGVCLLEIDEDYSTVSRVKWTASNSSVTVDGSGFVKAQSPGKVTVTATLGTLSDSVEITVLDSPDTSDPYADMSESEFYSSYTPARDFIDSYYRTQHSFLSGDKTVPGAAPTIVDNRPNENGVCYRSSDMLYEDNGNTYIVLNADGSEAFRVYRGAGYITLDEVAAYMFAFGGSENSFPAN